MCRDTLTVAGGLAVRVADTLSAADARRAAVAAIRAARRNGWVASQTAAIIPLLTAAAGWHAAAIPARAAIFAGLAATTATAAAAAISVLPGHTVVPLIRASPLPATAAHTHRHAHDVVTARTSTPDLIGVGTPITTGPTGSPSRGPAGLQGAAKRERSKSPRARRSSSLSPQPTTSGPAPSPTPSPSSSPPEANGACIGVVILNVCVTL
jgi:hypothetical protein